MARILGRGTFVTTIKPEGISGKVSKEFRFPLMEETAQKLQENHCSYVAELRTIIGMPETTMRSIPLEDGKFHIVIEQDDLSVSGSTLADFLNSEAKKDERMAAFGVALNGTLKVFMRSAEISASGTIIGLESNPNNWWVKADGKVLFFDTTPPLMAVGGKIDTDVLVPKENPTFLGKVMAYLARMPVIRKLSEKVIKNYAFDWPTTLRTFLIKTISSAPKMKEDFVKATRDAVGMLDISEQSRNQFQKKLTDFSINVELLKLKAFVWLASLGQKNPG